MMREAKLTNQPASQRYYCQNFDEKHISNQSKMYKQTHRKSKY
jgi:hypothetical protein